MRYYLAIDIGASSGRHIVGRREGGKIQTKEVYRFPNGVTEQDGRLTWDMDALLGQPCVMNIWTGDGFKDIPGDRMGPRVRYRQAIDEILSSPTTSSW